MHRPFFILALSTWLLAAPTAMGMSCSYDVRLARIPAQFQAFESDSEMHLKRFALVSKGYTDREADALMFGWKKDLCIRKFLRHVSSKAFHDFALAHDLRLPNEQVLLLSLLRFPTLVRLLKAQGSGDPSVGLEIGPEDVIFHQVSERIGLDLQPTTIQILRVLYNQENEDRNFLWSLLKYHEEHVPYFADSKNTP